MFNRNTCYVSHSSEQVILVLGVVEITPHLIDNVDYVVFIVKWCNKRLCVKFKAYLI